jgi:hypothetical protein
MRCDEDMDAVGDLVKNIMQPDSVADALTASSGAS